MCPSMQLLVKGSWRCTKLLMMLMQKVGKGNIINTFANIEHDIFIGNYCHNSTGVRVNGGTVIAEETFVGLRSVINQ